MPAIAASKSAGRLIDLVNKFNTTPTPISNNHYDYDDGNRLNGKTGTDGNSTVAYGNDNQISSVNNTTRPDENYSFDALGIRSGWMTDPLDKRRVLNDGVYQYQYDDEGNLTRKQEISSGKVTTYVWDYRNRLSRVNLSNGSSVEYGYDAEDRRVSKQINGVIKEKYVYDGLDIALVVDATGAIVERYLYGAGVDNVLSVVKAGTTVWSLADRQGSITDLVDASGAVLNHFVYDSFGNRTATTTADFRFGYTGRELDTETGLYYYRARYYDSGLGRFISEDPIGFSAGDTNLYRYVNNSPTNWTDPTGEIAFLPIVAAAWAAGLTGAGIGAAWGFAGGVAQSIDSDRRNGILGGDSIGSAYINGLIGAGKGAAIGFGFGFIGSFAAGTALAAGVAPGIVGGAVFGTGVAGLDVLLSMCPSVIMPLRLWMSLGRFMGLLSYGLFTKVLDSKVSIVRLIMLVRFLKWVMKVVRLCLLHALWHLQRLLLVGFVDLIVLWLLLLPECYLLRLLPILVGCCLLESIIQHKGIHYATV
jgi:RHS repeat-associated protein